MPEGFEQKINQQQMSDLIAFLLDVQYDLGTEAGMVEQPVRAKRDVTRTTRIQPARSSEINPVDEAYVWLCSQIGGPLDEPWSVSANVALQPYAVLSDVERPIREVISSEIANVEQLAERLSCGDFELL